MSKRYYYKALVKNVVDGDTFDMDVDMGFGITTRQRFRVLNYDAPESWRPKTISEGLHGQEAKGLATLLLHDEVVNIETFKSDVYGRFLVNITLPDGSDFVETMRNKGMVKLDVYKD